MSNINTMFPSKYYKAADVDSGAFEGGTVKGVVMEEIGEEGKKEDKPVMYFNEGDKGLVLNKTNASYLEMLYGAETDNWTGKIVVLKTSMVEFGGKPQAGIRIDFERVQQINTKNNAEPGGGGGGLIIDGEKLDDEIPF